MFPHAFGLAKGTTFSAGRQPAAAQLTSLRTLRQPGVGVEDTAWRHVKAFLGQDHPTFPTWLGAWFTLISLTHFVKLVIQ